MSKASRQFLEKLPLWSDRPAIGYACSLLLCAFAFLMRFAALPMLPIGYPYVSFFPAVILATFLFGRGPGIMNAILCGLVAWYCFTLPLYAFVFDANLILPFGFYVLVVTVDILIVYWMQQANRRLLMERERSRILAERSETLFQELQHRVSNNLQVVGGLLTLQKRDIDDEGAREALEEAARRLNLIGRIHRQLYDPSGRQLRLGSFLKQVSADLIDTSGKLGVSCKIRADDDITLHPDEAVPVALIVAESIANAIEHGVGNRPNGLIFIDISRSANAVEISVADDGKGLPAGFDLASSHSLGLRLVQMLAKQLNGDFSLNDGRGAVARLTLPR